MKEGVDQVTLEPETMTSSTEHQHVSTQFTECVCEYLCDLCGAPQQVVDVVVELQLPLCRHVFDVGATENHLAGETRKKRESDELCSVFLSCLHGKLERSERK